jgi:NAD+ kinase
MPPLSKPFRSTRKFQIKHIGIVCKIHYSPANDLADAIHSKLKEHGITVTINQIQQDQDILIILGGDGTLLHVATQAAQYSIPVLGINMGNLGFLTERTEKEALTAVNELLTEEMTIENRMMLKATLTEPDKPQKTRYALNEVVINKGTLDRMLKLSTRTEHEYINTYKADGLIFSTPTGSTAYNLSAGGPLVYPGLASILVTPICPFMLSSRPVLLPAASRLQTRFMDSQNQTAQVIVDGQAAWDMNESAILVVEAAKQPLYLIVSPHRDYFAILRNKLHWGIGSKSEGEQDPS